MSKDEIKGLIVLIAVFALGALCGFFLGKGIYQPTFKEKVARDTVVVHDTITDYQPVPVDSAMVRYVTRYLPRVVTDTVVKTDVITCHDSVLVEVPITSKHYGSKDYEAWVSGYEPSLDSIKVYRETQVITETITRTVKDKGKHFFLDIGAGCEYQFNNKAAIPFAELGARLKLGKVGIGAYGGYSHDTKEGKASPYARAKVTYDIVGL